LALSILTLAATVASAAEVEQTRESYVASVEPICKVDKQASDRYLTGVSSLVKHDKLAKASQNFSKAAAVLEKAQRQLAAVPQPPADAAKLGKWLAGIKSEVGLMRQISAKLAAGDKGRASSLAVKLHHDQQPGDRLPVRLLPHRSLEVHLDSGSRILSNRPAPDRGCSPIAPSRARGRCCRGTHPLLSDAGLSLGQILMAELGRPGRQRRQLLRI
jgi:hypothetical protein